jgi:hypothetical protein
MTPAVVVQYLFSTRSGPSDNLVIPVKRWLSVQDDSTTIWRGAITFSREDLQFPPSSESKFHQQQITRQLRVPREGQESAEDSWVASFGLAQSRWCVVLMDVRLQVGAKD